MEANQPSAAASEETIAPRTGQTTAADAAINSGAVTDRIYEEAEMDNMHRDLQERLWAANNPPPKPEYVPPAVPDALLKMREAEMAAGAARVQHFANQDEARKALTQPKREEPWEGKSTPVFRPKDYVPDQKKGQGLKASASARQL